LGLDSSDSAGFQLIANGPKELNFLVPLCNGEKKNDRKKRGGGGKDKILDSLLYSK